MANHPPISQSDVLTWLRTNHPQLHAVAELDRDWVWLVVDLRGEHNKPVRESIKAFGFRFHFRGGHTLPNGRVGTWGHSCARPTGFQKRKFTKPDSKEEQISDDELLQLIEQQI